MNERIYRIGVIGTGRIAYRFVPEARTLNSVKIIAVYNPRLSSAKKFAEEFHIEYATDNMDIFLNLVDVVYIASPHETHVSYAKKMLENGKHVLCEKPMAMKETDVQELATLAETKRLVLMEAIKTAYCPGFLAILDFVKTGKIGQVIDVEAAFTKLTPSHFREYWDEKAGGSFIELGTYALLPIMKILGTKEKGVSYWCRNTLLGCDAYTKAIYDFATATATAKTGLGAKSEGQLLISGTKGYILVPAPWWLTRKVEIHYENANATEVYEYPFEEAGLRYEIEAFIKQVQRIGKGEQYADAGLRVSLQESMWLAKQLEHFVQWHNAIVDKKSKAYENTKPGIWAHRGCSWAYPENTLEAFEAAAKLKGITGIELDVQLTLDGELVVIHDETLDRTTNGSGFVRDFTLSELKKLRIESVNGSKSNIPTLREVFELLESYCKKNGLFINIELKNSIYRYEGMEEKTLTLVEEFCLEDYVIYSSFLPESMGLIKRLNPFVQTGILTMQLEDCLKAAKVQKADGLHPSNAGLEMLDLSLYKGYPIRVWNMEEPFFGQSSELKETKMIKYAQLGATDIITNVPERYC